MALLKNQLLEAKIYLSIATLALIASVLIGSIGGMNDAGYSGLYIYSMCICVLASPILSIYSIVRSHKVIKGSRTNVTDPDGVSQLLQTAKPLRIISVILSFIAVATSLLITLTAFTLLAFGGTPELASKVGLGLFIIAPLSILALVISISQVVKRRRQDR